MMPKLKSWMLATLVLQLAVCVADARPIQIVGAVYGTLATGKTCNATSAIEAMCTGRARCDVNIQNALCADPDFLVVKQAQIRYRCGRKTLSVIADEYKTTTIACE